MDGSPNALAYLSLFLFVPFGIAMFFMFRPPLAALIVFLSAFMFLPELTSLKVPGLPSIGKQEVAALSCLFGCLLRARKKLFKAKAFRGPDIIFLFLFVGDVCTAMTNRDVIVHGAKTLQALDLHEGFSVIMLDVLVLYLPFLIGRALFTTYKDLQQVLVALAVAGAIYTPFLFIELMMSPQLNNWIFGFHQHDFIQTMRAGGYRPMVFMPHGLAVGLFMAWSVIAAVILRRTRKRLFGLPAILVGVYNFIFLFWIKSLGAMIYALVVAPIVWFLKPKAIVRIAAILGVIVFTYPVSRATDIFPEKGLVNLATSVAGGERAQSLEFRFNMEAILNEHARERPWFGWGRFQRSMTFDDYTGRATSVSDGYWIVAFSIRGAWGFVFMFLPVLAPIFYLRRKLKKIEAQDERLLVAGFAMILAIGAVDLLPNAMWNCILYLFAGMLWSVTKEMAKPRVDEDFGYDSGEVTADEPTERYEPTRSMPPVGAPGQGRSPR